MAGKLYRSKVTKIRELPGGVVVLSFQPQVPFKFHPGQFVSLQVPNYKDPKEMLWRAYSLALPYELSILHGYELCIKKIPNGQAGRYLDTLKVGDWIQVRAPYGEFTLESKPGRAVALIGTGTGVAPLRSIALSDEFKKRGYKFAIALLGVRDLGELPYPGDFERVGVTTTYALSDVTEPLEFPFYNGRVTSVLRSLRDDFPWSEVDFYLCGNAFMIADVKEILKSKGVKEKAIFAEAFDPAHAQKLPKVA